MEFQYIIFIGVLLFMSYIVKKAQKQAQQSQQNQTPLAPDETMWENFPFPAEESEQEGRIPSLQEQAGAWHNVASAERISSSERHDMRESVSEYLAHQKRIEIEEEQHRQAENPSVATHSVLTGFDLKQAVIYSEILKPKFLEE